MQRQAKKHALFCVTELNVHVGVGGVEAACVRCIRDKKAIKGVAVAGAMKMTGGGGTLVLLAPLQLDDDGCAHQAVQEGFGVDGCKTLRKGWVSATEMRGAVPLQTRRAAQRRTGAKRQKN